MPAPCGRSCAKATTRPVTEGAFNVAEFGAVVSAAVVTVSFVGSFLLLLIAAVFQR